MKNPVFLAGSIIGCIIFAGLATESVFGSIAAGLLIAVICFATDDILTAIRRK